MAIEKEWVRSIQPRLDEALRACHDGEWKVRVDTGEKLTYALTYSAKAATHKHVCLYLRYGILIGDGPSDFCLL